MPAIPEQAGAAERGDGAGAIELVAGGRVCGGGGLPLELGRQAGAGPDGKGICLIEADVGDGGVRRDLAAAGEAEAGPGAALRLPVQRGGDGVGLRPGPAIGEPQAGLGIAAIGDEIRPVGIGDEAVGELEGAEQHFMRRALAIKGEGRAIMADAGDAGVMPCPAGGGGRRGGRGGRVERRLQRVGAEQIEDIGNEQLLVLHLVVAAKLGEAEAGGIEIEPVLGQRGIDMGAPGQHFGEAGAGDEAALLARQPGADSFIVAVEQIAEARIERLVAGQAGEHERLEKPGGVRQVPLCRRGIGHGLGAGIRIRERRDQRNAERPHIEQLAVEKMGWAGHAAQRLAPGTHNTSPVAAFSTRESTKR